MVVGSVCQSAFLLREKRKRREWEKIYSKPYLTLLLWPSFFPVPTCQTVERQSENKTYPLWPVLHFTPAMSCHAWALVASRYHLSSSLSFFIHHYRRLLLRWRQTSASLKGSRWHWMNPDEKALSLSDCSVVLIRGLLINCHRDQSEGITTQPEIYYKPMNRQWIATWEHHLTKLWMLILLNGVFRETVSGARLSVTDGEKKP